MHIIIAGNGRMAKALGEVCHESNVTFAKFDSKAPRVACAVAVHLGSGRQLQELHDYCAPLNIPIIQGSTGQTLPDVVKTVVVDAPNLALPIVYMMGVVSDIHTNLDTMFLRRRGVRESHQASKTSLPGTAVKFAEALKLEKKRIVSERKPDVQLGLGVPQSHLERHGYHWITWEFSDMEIEIVTRVRGLRPYATGALIVARNLLDSLVALEIGIYPVSRFI